MNETPRTQLAAYGVAVLATLICLLIRWPLWPVLGDALPNMTFFLAVMLAAYYGGFWPGMLTTILGAVAANYFLARPSSTFEINMVGLVLFVVTCMIISALCESLHRVRRRLVAQEGQRASLHPWKR